MGDWVDAVGATHCSRNALDNSESFMPQCVAPTVALLDCTGLRLKALDFFDDAGLAGQQMGLNS